MLRAIAAVAKRELIIFRRYPSWLIGAVMWPVLFPAAYIFSVRALAGPDATPQTYVQALGVGDYEGFLIVGTTLWMWVNMTLWSMGSALRQEQLGGTLEANWLTPAPRFAILAGDGVANGAIALLQMVVSSVLFMVVYGFHIRSPLASLAAFLANFPWVYGLGLLFASLVVWVKEVNGMVQVVRGIFLILCGMTYPIAVLPVWLQGVSWALPLTHGIAALRQTAVAGASWSSISGDLVWLLGWGAALLAAGRAAFQWTDRRMRRLGSVSTY
ncbi:MAG: ABC transporter permease [Clostridia bacterium]|nr:ABC transporter permease [Clostridia bacterium]